MTDDPNYFSGATLTEYQQLRLSEAGWIYEINAETETAGWRDPAHDPESTTGPLLHSTDSAHRLLVKRNRPIRDQLPHDLK